MTEEFHRPHEVSRHAQPEETAPQQRRRKRGCTRKYHGAPRPHRAEDGHGHAAPKAVDGHPQRNLGQGEDVEKDRAQQPQLFRGQEQVFLELRSDDRVGNPIELGKDEKKRGEKEHKPAFGHRDTVHGWRQRDLLRDPFHLKSVNEIDDEGAASCSAINSSGRLSILPTLGLAKSET